MNRSMKQLELVGLVQNHSSIQVFSATLKRKMNGKYTNEPQATTIELESVLIGCDFVTMRHIMFLARAEK